MHTDHLTLATALCVSFDACDGTKFAYCCTSHDTSVESNSHLDKFICKLVCTAGDASGKPYFYGDMLAHDVTACSV